MSPLLKAIMVISPLLSVAIAWWPFNGKPLARRRSGWLMVSLLVLNLAVYFVAQFLLD